MSEEDIIKKPFEDVFGRLVLPGDRISIITTSYKQVYIREGIYKGYVEYKPLWRSDKIYKLVKAQVKSQRTRLVRKDTGEPANWWSADPKEVEFITEEYLRNTTLKLNRIIGMEGRDL